MKELYGRFIGCNNLQIDSRKVQEGDAFWAIKGERYNANAFVSEVLDRGAALVVVDEEVPEWKDNRVHRVVNGLQALQELARYHRQQLRIPVIGLTGSNGKTTTKELMREVLSSAFNVLATQGNLNNHIGVPLSLLAIKPHHQMAIIEMGANAQGEISFLSSIAQPDIGYVTNFGLAHLEGFGGPEGVIRGKSELYYFLRDSQKLCLVNADDAIQLRQSIGLNRVLFGQKLPLPYQFKLESESPFVISHNGRKTELNLIGSYNFSNVAAAFTLGLHFNISETLIESALKNYVPGNQRSEFRQTERNKVIVDCYNSNPSSLEAALKNFALYEGKRLAILGDMFELGEFEHIEHQRMIDLCVKLGIEEVLLVGKAFSKTDFPDFVRNFSQTDEALKFLMSQALTNRFILLKGSRGMSLERLIPAL